MDGPRYGIEKAAAEKAYREAETRDACASGPYVGQVSEPVSQEAWMQSEIDRWFTYRAPSDSQHVAMKNIREAGKVLALTILANSKDGSDQRQSLDMVRAAVMFACRSVTG